VITSDEDFVSPSYQGDPYNHNIKITEEKKFTTQEKKFDIFGLLSCRISGNRVSSDWRIAAYPST
jgi:hypothetical protein